MPDFSALWNQVHDRISHSTRQPPSTITIPRERVSQSLPLGAAFVRDQNYFQVLINEMYLVDQRKWFDVIDPMVFVASEFTYDKKVQTVPFMVGPSLMEQHGREKTPSGMVFSDTSVSGLFPYRGGGLTLTVVLCQVQVDNYARRLLRVVESVAKSLDFSPVLSPYTKMADVVLEGFTALLEGGATTPLVGLRHQFSPNASIPFEPGYFVLIDKPDVNPDTLWVKDRRLMKGPSEAEATPYREADYVLYSVVGPADNKRDDLDTLPFSDMWDLVRKEALVPKEQNFDNARLIMASLYQKVALSPDLTQAQADELAEEYNSRMRTLHQKSVDLAKRGPAAEREAPDPMDAVRSRALSILRS